MLYKDKFMVSVVKDNAAGLSSNKRDRYITVKIENKTDKK